MHIRAQCLIIVIVTALSAVDTSSIDHDKVQPFPQPQPKTISEKAGVRFKPALKIEGGCVSFPAVNAAGDTSGGLKGTAYNSGCKVSPLNSQVYGRAAWHNDIWAIMYGWYFPKSFWDSFATRRHDWASAVVWIDNPALEAPKILGLSLSVSDTKYTKEAPAPFIENGTTPSIPASYT